MGAKRVAIGIGLLFLLLAVSRSEPAHALPLANGDFSLGNTGFASDYAFSPGDIFGEGSYDVVADPQLAHPFATSYGDHTSGDGLMLAVNGAVDAGRAVWSETVDVLPDTPYVFSLWVSSWFAGSPAHLAVRFDGSVVGELDAPSAAGVWQRFSAPWTSGPDSSVTIAIEDLVTAEGGNDFALDDLALRVVPESTTAALVLLGLSVLAVGGSRRA